MTRSPLTRYVEGERTPVTREAKRRYMRAHLGRPLTTAECEERPLDDPRDYQVNIVVGGVVHCTQDRAFAEALVRAVMS